MKKLTIKDMQKLARKKKGECLSNEYINACTKLKWRCEKGHVWEAKPTNIRGGRWCPRCTRVESALKRLQEIAKSKGGRCLSTDYVDVQTKLKWRCKKGHVWESRPTNIIKGHWCTQCAGLKKLTIEEMRGLAESRGGKCLSSEYVNAHTKLKWQCKEGHVWEARPYDIKQGRWCPRCARVKLTIKDLQEIAESRGGKCLSPEYVNVQTKLKWQCKEGHVWETRPVNIRKGHWCIQCAGLKRLTIEEMQERVKSRGGKCLSSEYINARIKLKWQCEKGHVWEAKPMHIKKGNWCPHCAGVAKLTIKDMQELAESRGGKCLSEEYVDRHKKLKWQCEKGHVWETKPNIIKSGSWCPHCAGVARLTLKDMQELAESRGGKCLSKEYTGRYTKLKWKCKKGHVWEARPGAIKKGSWCRKCNKIKKIKIKETKKRNQKKKPKKET